MKLFFKKIIPRFIWKSARVIYVYVLRLFTNILQTSSFSHPADWIRVFLLVRKVRPDYTMVRPPRLRVLYELSKKINLEGISGDIVEC